MQSTRWAIMNLLRKSGKATVKDLSDSLSLTSTCIRQHLTVLERDGLIGSSEIRGEVGRPCYVYLLTEEGEALFPKSYDTLASWIVEEIKLTEGEDRLVALLKGLAARLAESHSERLAGKSFGEKVSELSQILRERGSLAEWEEKESKYVIKEYACPFHRVAKEHRQICILEAQFISKLLDTPVGIGKSMLNGDCCCTYLVSKAPDLPREEMELTRLSS